MRLNSCVKSKIDQSNYKLCLCPSDQAGAAKVYAVEGSSIAKHATDLVRHNKVDHVIKVLSGKIEEIELPEKVDMIISEPMG